MAVPATAELVRERLVEPRDHGIIALDDMTWERATEVMAECSPYIGMAKANSIAQSHGWLDANLRARAYKARLMADAKYKDTKRTMLGHVESTARDGSQFITVHIDANASGLKGAVHGRDRARSFMEQYSDDKEFDATIGSLLGITILTSYDDEECMRIYGDTIANKVKQFTGMAIEAGLEGIVCGASDLEVVAEVPDSERLIKVVPGIVLDNSAPLPEGQQRVATAEEAIAWGADFAVFGSAVTKATNIRTAAMIGNQQIAAGLERRS